MAIKNLSSMDWLRYIYDFESALAEFTGAPYVVTTDRCTHAMELCLRYQKPERVSIPRHTYLSIPQTLLKLGISWDWTDNEWQYEHPIGGTTVWDSARLFKPKMYVPGRRQCISFGLNKPLEMGIGGAILLDSQEEYDLFSKQRSDGRDLRVAPWESAGSFPLGYHYWMRPEDCRQGIDRLANGQYRMHDEYYYPDLSKLVIG